MRIPLDDDGWIVVRSERSPGEVFERGPQPAGRVSDRLGEGIVEASQTLRAALQPVVSMSRVVLDELKAAAPREVEVEFGVELSAEAGAVIAQAAGACHLQVKLTWGGDPPAGSPGRTS